jgi:hypothetical protein
VRIALLVAITIITGLAHADTIFDRLRDDSGEVAGLPGWKIQRKPDKNRCGGIAIVTIRGKKKLAADDQPMAKVFALEFPKGLNFSPDPRDKKVKEASLKRFNDFAMSMTALGSEGRNFYEKTIKLASAENLAETRVRAAARITQIQMRLASVVARAEIPKDVRTGEFAAEKIEAFCDKMAEVSEPLLVNAEQAMTVCAEVMANAPLGWWTAVCTK